MKIALLTRTMCFNTKPVVEYFRQKGIDIDMVIIEKNFRKKYSTTEKRHRAAHDAFNRHTQKYGVLRRTARSLWDRMPLTIKAFFEKNIYYLPVLNRLSVKKFCKKAGIRVFEVHKHSSQRTRQIIEQHKINYVLMISSNWLLKEPLIATPVAKIIHAHPGILPMHKGLDSIGWALLEGDSVGMSTHFIDAGVDSGDILKVYPVEVRQAKSLNEVTVIVGKILPYALYDTVISLEEGNISPVKQTDDIPPHKPMTFEQLCEVDNKIRQNFGK